MDLARRVRGCTKEFKGRLKNDCNTDESLSLSLSLSLFSFPAILFFELSLMLHDFYFSLSVFFYFFFNPPAAIWKMEEPDLPCFLHDAGCQCNDLRLLRWALDLRMFFFFFFQNILASFNNTAFPSV